MTAGRMSTAVNIHRITKSMRASGGMSRSPVRCEQIFGQCFAEDE